MAEIRYKIRFWNWDGENECYSVDTEVFTDRDAAERCFIDHDATPALPFIQLLQEKIANGCVIDEATIKERKRQEATVFEAITKDKPTLAGFLRSLPVIEAPWDDTFHKRYCAGCGKQDCDVCPNEEFRSNPEWWLSLKAEGAEL
ncbi:MAG: hypothetical protein K1W28_03405 [Lachnospiraceae bacterium]